jgi:hypothetical protein
MQRPPDNEIPIRVPIVGVLNQTSEIAFALTSVETYSAGVIWTIDIFKRVPAMFIGAYGFGRPETSGRSSAPYLLGFEWADGSISSNMPRPDNNGGGLHHSNGSGGTRQHTRSNFWLDHLPPPGPFSIITAWPFFDIPEHQVNFDATLITDAAARVKPLWDRVDATLRNHDDIPTVDNAILVIPRTGWFGEHFDDTPPPKKYDEHGNELHFRAFGVDGQGKHVPLTPAPRGWQLADADE